MIEIRQAEAHDLDSIIALYQQLHPADLNFDDAPEVFKQMLEQDGLVTFVLESAGQIASSCYLNIIPNLTRSTSPYAVIENVITDETQRGRGFGKMVIKHAIEYAWSQNCYKVMLMTGSKEASTHAFYRACGFNGDEKQAYIVRRPST